MRPMLQLALDVDSLDEAIRLAEQTAPWVDWLEVGTSLIVSEGVRAVRALRQRFPNTTLVADVKIIDGAEGLASLLFEAGADMVTVVSSAYDDTFAAAIRTAHGLSRRVVAEYYSLDFSSPASFMRLARLGADYVGLHVPYEPKDLRSETIGAMGDVVRAVQLPTILAGGVDAGVLSLLKGIPLTGVIVGAAITRATVPAVAAQAIAGVLAAWPVAEE